MECALRMEFVNVNLDLDGVVTCGEGKLFFKHIYIQLSHASIEILSRDPF